MSASLDKALDDIIAEKPRPKKVGGPKGVKKPVSKNAKVGKTRPAPKRPTATSSLGKALDVSSATKAVVYGLPKDIKQDTIKEFFAKQVGGVQSVHLTYNERGQSKGIATVVFKNPAAASRAVDKYNGAPIDGGKTKLRIELILDPTKKPLASRIVPNGGSQAASRPKPKPKAGKPAVKESKAKKPVKKAKKTLEELDQEMTDYFEKKD